jgi:hypothetical protein
MPNTPPCSLFCSMPYEILPVWCRPCWVQRCCCASSHLTCRYLSYVHRCPDRSASWDNRWPLVHIRPPDVGSCSLGGLPSWLPAPASLSGRLTVCCPCRACRARAHLPTYGADPRLGIHGSAPRLHGSAAPRLGGGSLIGSRRSKRGPSVNSVPLLTWTFWSGRPDLNRRPLDPQSSALPNCATSRPPMRTL